MHTLLVDNYDSYTFNLFQLIAEVNGATPVVIVNDDPSLVALGLGIFDNIVISPGQVTANPRDVGYVSELLRRTTPQLPVTLP